MCCNSNLKGEKDIELMFMSYMNKVILYSKKDFYKANKRITQHEIFSLNEFDSTGEEERVNRIEDVSANKDLAEIAATDIEDLFTDKTIYMAVKGLSTKQKQVLYLKHVKGMTEREIAETLHITRQAVSKTRKAAIKNILHEYMKHKESIN